MKNCYEQLLKLKAQCAPEEFEKKVNKYLDQFPCNGLTLEKIGELFGISKERVRQIERNAIKKLRHPKYGLILQELLGVQISI